MDEARDFGHVVVNDDVEKAVAELDEIVSSELSAVSRR
jgi:guanylate kinase